MRSRVRCTCRASRSSSRRHQGGSAPFRHPASTRTKSCARCSAMTARRSTASVSAAWSSSLVSSESHDPAEIIEAYYERGWTDGLPVLPPTEKSVADMLAAAGLHADEVVGTIPARSTVIVARKVAINAVMAGCRPEYLPVVVAAIRGLCHPHFAYNGPASSTGGSAMVLIINGPIARTLRVNSGNNAFGQGTRANATVGRAVRLCMMNVMNTRPGFLDRATLGNPGKYAFCFAEN